MSLAALQDAVAAVAGQRDYGVAISSVRRVYRVRLNIAGVVVAHAEERDLDKAVCAALETLRASQENDGLEFLLRRSIQLAKEKKVAR